MGTKCMRLLSAAWVIILLSLSSLPTFAQTQIAPTLPLTGSEKIVCVQNGSPRGCTVSQVTASVANQSNTWTQVQTFNNKLIYTATGGSTPRSAQDRAADCINVFDYGAKGDNATDDAAAFSSATTAAIAANKAICIKRASYALSTQWVMTSPVDIFMDPSANIRFTNASNCGILFDFRSAGSNYGLNNVKLGGIYSPSINSSFSFPGYPSSWSSSARASCDAVLLEGGSRINLDANYIVGFSSAVHLQGTYDGTNGARGPENINVNVNTADLNTYGINIDGGASGAGTVTAINAVFNTNFAKFPVYFNSLNNAIGEVTVKVTGQAFTNEAGGACVYDAGSNTNTSNIEITWCSAGYASDSPTGTSTSLIEPYLAGIGTSNSQTTDANCSLAYWSGSNNTISIGAAVNLAGTTPSGYLPASGRCVRIKDVGTNNTIRVLNYEQTQGSATALATTEGESNFNGGVGSAFISRKMLVSAVVPTLSAGQTAQFYFYNALLSHGGQKPLDVRGVDGTLAGSGLTFVAYDNAANVNREGIVQVVNKSGSSITGTTYYFWVTIQ